MSDPYNISNSIAFARNSQVAKFIGHCASATSRSFADYSDFDAWAVREFEVFWRLFLDWTGIEKDGSGEVVYEGSDIEKGRFFPNVLLNYASAILAGRIDAETAIVAARHGQDDETITGGQLRRRVLRLASHLDAMGVTAGDRIVAISRNRAEAVVVALACALIGATFSSCSHDMGAEAILARVSRLGPVALFAHVASEPWDVGAPLDQRITRVSRSLPGLRYLVVLDRGVVENVSAEVISYEKLLWGADDEPQVRRVELFPFNHPLYILFSSGTTGEPKCILHGAGGTLIEHLKEHRLHCDLKTGDRLYFHTGCAWMMWNWQLSALASGAEIVLYDGPMGGAQTLWDLVARLRVTVFGTGPAYLQLCEQAGYRPRDHHDLSALRSVLSTGSILHDRQFDWFARSVKPVPLQSISGGTDILGCFVLGNPLRDVSPGEAQGRSLGMDVRSLRSGPDEVVGELVCANPFPSRPLGFFGDDGSRFRRAYFSQNPPFWTHGDRIEFTPAGGVRLHGRSDDVMNIRGIRIGPADLYDVLKRIAWVKDALAVERAIPGEGTSELLLFVILDDPLVLDDERRRTIRKRLHDEGSPAYVPSLCVQVGSFPETVSGKKSEASVRAAVNGRPVENAKALRNPDCLPELMERLRSADEAAVPPPAGDRPDALSADGLRSMISSHLRFEIGLDDSLMECGADSLTIVSIINSLRSITDRYVGIDDIILAPTPRKLSEHLSDSLRGKSDGLPRPAAASIRPATDDDLDEVCALLQSGFSNPRVAAADWRRLATAPWRPADSPYGYVLVRDGRIVGFLGTLFVDQAGTDGGKTTICNLTSWYVEPAHRTVGIGLLSAALESPHTTFTSLTPARSVATILKDVGFVAYARLDFFGPRLGGLRLRWARVQIDINRTLIRDRLPFSQQKIFDTHRYPGLLHILVSNDTESTYLIAKRRVMIWRGWAIGVSELIYIENLSVLHRHFDRVVNRLLLAQRTVLFSIEDRFSPLGIRPLRTSQLSRYSKSLDLRNAPQPIYSELALIDI